jgi:adenylylsulfate kinase
VSWAVWITGPPGSGKSVLARAVAAALDADTGRPVVLELDEIRKVLTPSPTYSDSERDVVYRALAYMAAQLTEIGRPVIIDATAHRRAWRDLARRSIAHFAEVQLVCPLEVCREREARREGGHAPRGIYARAGHPGARVPGVDVPYEAAPDAELTLDTSQEPLARSAGRVAELVRHRLAAPSEPLTGAPRAGWAMWITGLPGSGKTTLACSAAEALAARSIPARVLDLAEMRAALLADHPESETTREIVHRALAYTVKLLTDAGVAVIVDATAPRRAWRQLARDLVTHFAEVQLVCPHELCDARERATRWGLGARSITPPGARRLPNAPDIVLDYEPPLHPELVLHTDTQALWGTLDSLLRLADRLHLAATAEGHSASRNSAATS